MSETSSKDERVRFKQVEPLCIYDVSVQNDDVDWLLQIEIRDQYITIEEAYALREWLNKVLPT